MSYSTKKQKTLTQKNFWGERGLKTNTKLNQTQDDAFFLKVPR